MAEMIEHAVNTRDEQLAYVFETPSNNPAGLAIIMHGRRSEKGRPSYSDIASIAQQHDFSTVKFDFRGHGDSHDNPNWHNYGVIDAAEDIDAIVSHAKKRGLPGSSHITLVATSFSADPSLLYAAEHEDIERIVLVSPGTGKGSSGTDSNHNREDWWDRVKDTTQIDFASFKDKLANLGQRVDLIHGDEDEHVPIEQSAEIVSIVGANAVLHSIEGGLHHYMQPPEAFAERQRVLHDIFEDIKTQRHDQKNG